MHQHLSRRSGSNVALAPAASIESSALAAGNISPPVERERREHSHSSVKRWPNACLLELGPGTKIVVGNAGDHGRILSLLSQHYQSSLADDFQSRLDEPCYEPSDRMLVVHRVELIVHVQVSRQAAWFEHERIPVAAVRDFVIPP